MYNKPKLNWKLKISVVFRILITETFIIPQCRDQECTWKLHVWFVAAVCLLPLSPSLFTATENSISRDLIAAARRQSISNCIHHEIIFACAIDAVLRSKVWWIFFRITIAIVVERWVILIVLISLILFLIELIESPPISIRKTMPRILGTQMSELRWMNVKLSVRVTVRWHVVGNYVHWGHFVFLLPLHSTILEPKRIKVFFCYDDVMCIFYFLGWWWWIATTCWSELTKS